MSQYSAAVGAHDGAVAREVEHFEDNCDFLFQTPVVEQGQTIAKVLLREHWLLASDADKHSKQPIADQLWELRILNAFRFLLTSLNTKLVIPSGAAVCSALDSTNSRVSKSWLN